jgi:trk system potassium uptake protein TrkA
MHVTILGASRFGVATAGQLIKAGHEVVLIDIEKARLDELSDGLDCAMVCGDGTLPSTLRDAYGDGSDALVALTNHDDVNILAAVVGRSVGYERLVPQIVRPELLSVVEELDIGDVITPHESLARSIVSALTEHGELDTDMALHRELRLVNHVVPEELAGTTLGDLDLPKGVRPVAHADAEAERLADPGIALSAGDHLFFVAANDAVKPLNRLFGQKG